MHINNAIADPVRSTGASSSAASCCLFAPVPAWPRPLQTSWTSYCSRCPARLAPRKHPRDLQVPAQQCVSDRTGTQPASWQVVRQSGNAWGAHPPSHLTWVPQGLPWPGARPGEGGSLAALARCLGPRS